MATSPQRLTIYLYSAHRAVIFAIAQLSCKNIYRFIFSFVKENNFRFYCIPFKEKIAGEVPCFNAAVDLDVAACSVVAV